MKSPTYITKRPYIQYCQEKFYLSHVASLQAIDFKRAFVHNKVDQEIKRTSQIRSNKTLARKFQEGESAISREVENRCLLDKIYKGNRHRATKSMHPKSLIAPAQRVEQQRILEENIRLAKRIRMLPSTIKPMQQDYANHQKDVQNIRRFYNDSESRNVMSQSSKFRSTVKDDKFFMGNSRRFNEASRSTVSRQTNNSAPILDLMTLTFNIHQIVFHTDGAGTHTNEHELGKDLLFFIEISIQHNKLIRTKPMSLEHFSMSKFQLNMTKAILFDSNDQLQLAVFTLKGQNQNMIGSCEIEQIDLPQTFDPNFDSSPKSSISTTKVIRKGLFRRIQERQIWTGVLHFSLDLKEVLKVAQRPQTQQTTTLVN